MCTDVVVVGGGPVGLWTAIQIKKRRPDMDVQVYERYQEYKRSHVLKLELLSLLLYGKNHDDISERAFYDAVAGKKDLDQMTGRALAGDSVFIRTNDLEGALKQFAAKLGVNLAYEKIDSPDDVMAKHPECQMFVAADGAHSRMRAAILGADAKVEEPLQYVVEVKYEADGETTALPNFRDQYKTNKITENMGFEYVGRAKNGKTPVTLRFFVDKETYEALPQAGFKNPMGLDDPRLPENLAQDIKTYMNIRRDKAGEHYSEGSAKLSKLTLSVYAAKEFAVEHKKKSWFLVGDAAMGVPYFRALNSGLIIGSQLGYILTRKRVSPRNKIRAYNAVRPLDKMWEFTAARGKDIGLSLYDTFRRVSRKVPWETVKWKKKDADAYRKREHRAFKPKGPADKP